VIVLANLDCESRMAGRVLPLAVRRRLSLLATLLRVYAEPGDEVRTPEPVPRACLRSVPELAPTTWRVLGADPPRADLRLAWCSTTDAARSANDRHSAFALGSELGTLQPGTIWLDGEAALSTARFPAGPWVFKARYSAAGRERVFGRGPPAAEEGRVRIARLLRQQGGGVLEPWLDRTEDLGYGPSGAPHRLLVDARGGFCGIVRPGPTLSDSETAAVARVRQAVQQHLAALGHEGPWGVDAWRYTDATGKAAFQPLGEINARLTFGAVAAALHERVAIPRWGTGCAMALRFGEAPEGRDPLCIPLVGNEAGDRMYAWIERLPETA
jgi:hypothetical protein